MSTTVRDKISYLPRVTHCPARLRLSASLSYLDSRVSLTIPVPDSYKVLDTTRTLTNHITGTQLFFVKSRIITVLHSSWLCSLLPAIALA